MRPRLKPWVKLPSKWIEDGGLLDFRWGADGAANIAAIMTLIGIAHRADAETGVARLTYDEFEAQTGRSRATIAAGLDVLVKHSLVVREPEGRSTYQLAGYDPQRGWAKLPAAGLYNGDKIAAFHHLSLRRRIELDALKFYLLIAARRDNEENHALLTYEKFEERAGVNRERIRPAISLLAGLALVHIEHLPRPHGQPGVVSGYRLANLDSYRHMGTTGRGFDSSRLSDE